MPEAILDLVSVGLLLATGIFVVNKIFGPRKSVDPGPLRVIPLTGVEMAEAAERFANLHTSRLIQDIEEAEKLLSTDEIEYERSSSAGKVYVLVNPSMPGLVKIGWTKGSSEERARQLSSVTGVATEFVVVYDELVSNAATVERQIHQALNEYRYNQNREFFKISAKEAIASVRKTCGEAGGQYEHHLNLSEPTDSESLEDILSKAEDYDYGLDDCPQDLDQAVELYKEAAVRGSADAFVRIAELHAGGYIGDPSITMAIGWLESGTQMGYAICYYEIARIYLGDDPWGEENVDHDMAANWLRICLEVAPINKSNEFALFIVLRRYLRILAGTGLRGDDLETAIDFRQRFMDYLESYGDDKRYLAKRQDIAELFPKDISDCRSPA